MVTSTAAARPTSKVDILAAVQSGAMSVDEAAKLLSSGGAKQRLHCKVSEKGGVSVYGLQRMPVTLYVEQWLRLIEFIADEDGLVAFLKANDKLLKRKGE